MTELSPEAKKLIQFIGDMRAVNGSIVDPPFVNDLYAWSKVAYGPGKRTKGILDHIRKELNEIEDDPDDLEEWIDVILLALNGAQRLDVGGKAIIEMLYTKIEKNARRTWPDWRTADPDKAIEHVSHRPDGMEELWNVVQEEINKEVAASISKEPSPLSKDLNGIVDKIEESHKRDLQQIQDFKNGVMGEEPMKVRTRGAKKIYDYETDNDPIVHSNRFPSWEELTDEQKTEYYKKFDNRQR